MTENRYIVEVQSDFLERQSKARPLNVIAELIWNGLDADATRVSVHLENDELRMTKISVRDNGDGIPYADAPKLFQRLGGSWKTPGGVTKVKGRMLHGYEGRGRFKVFALGRVADWRVKYRADDGELYCYNITMMKDNICEILISDVESAEEGEPGVEVQISELQRDFRSLVADKAVQELAEVFALYLKDYRNVSIFHGTQQVDPNAFIAETHVSDLSDIDDGEENYPAKLEIIEWRSVTNRDLFLCTEHGFPLTKVSTRFHLGNFQFSAYLKSPFITRLNAEAQLDLAEMNPLMNQSIDEARRIIMDFFRDRAAERARTVVDDWKAEDVYPYKGEAETSIEDAERKIFDILAVTASDYMPNFQSSPQKKKAYDLRMLRTAIEKSPEDLQLIMSEVLDLPKRKQEEFASLLREASLSSIISAAKIIADRLKFLSGLEQILFDKDMKSKLKERSQLHKIIEDNTWLFGEEYNLSVSDKGLTAVLQAHAKDLGIEIVVDKPVKHIYKKTGIVDLMLSKVLRRHRADEIEHLVVELKRPSVKINHKEIAQIEKYALSVVNDERFRTANGVKWGFWALSDDIGDYAEFRMNKKGVIFSKDDVTIGIKTWGKIIAENKARLQFIQEKLEHQVDDEVALGHLHDKYHKFLSGVIADASSPESDD